MESEHPININPKDISDALARVVSSTEFEKAYRLRQLLEHLVTKQLAGEEDDLKGYNLGLDVFEKGKNFDPDTDTIVRVQMVRLRRMLEHYYLTHGKDDAVIIEIPKGRYVPAYHQAEGLDNEEHATRVLDAVSTLGRRLKEWFHSQPYLFALGLGALLFFAWLSSSLLPTIQPAEQTTVMKRFNYRIPTGPSVAVFPFNNETQNKKFNALIRGFPAHIIHSLTRFKELFILAPETTLLQNQNNARERGDIRRVNIAKARSLEIDYALTGGFGASDKGVVLSAFLTRVDTGQIIWSKDFQRRLTGANLHEMQTNIAGSIARELGQPYGVINRLESALRLRSEKLSYSAYDCVLGFFAYQQHESEKKHLETRECLENTLKKEPGYARAWAALSWIYVDEYRHGFNKKTGDSPAIDRAFIAARKAVVLDPEDAFNHRRLAAVLTTRGDLRAGQGAIEKAVELNPNDADVLAHYGWNLKQLGNWSEAYLYARKAMRLNPGHPPWYLETPAFYFYYNQDCRNAHQTAEAYYLLVPESVLREVLVVISGMLCKRENISKHVQALNTNYPSFLTQPGRLFRDLGVPLDMHPEIIAHLQEAGVAVDG